MAVNDIYQVVVQCQYASGDYALNVLHYRVAAVGTGIAGQLLADSANTVFSTVYKAALPATVNYLGVTAQKIFPLPISDTWSAGAGAGAGDVAGVPGDYTTSIVITKRTGLAGRKFRGRLFVPAVPVAWRENGRLASNLDKYEDIASAVAAGLTNSGNDFLATLWHRSTSTYNDITATQVQTTLRVQRRRERGVGI